MQPERTLPQEPRGDLNGETWQRTLVARTWQATMAVGVLTLILGLVVTFHPTGSLTVIAVLLGVLLIISGIFHLIRVFDAAEPHRVWLGIAGLVFVVAGVVLIRDLHLTLAVIGLLIGLDWIVQGIASLIAGLTGGPGEGRVWWAFFGVVSLIAGIVVVAAPISSVTVLAVLLGMWFVVMGLLEIIGSVMLRRASGPARMSVARTPHGTTAGM